MPAQREAGWPSGRPATPPFLGCLEATLRLAFALACLLPGYVPPLVSCMSLKDTVRMAFGYLLGLPSRALRFPGRGHWIWLKNPKQVDASDRRGFPPVRPV